MARFHDIAPEQVALGHGAGQLLQAALRRLGAGGDAVMPWPAWELLPALAARAGARPVPIRLAPDGSVDLTALAAAVGEQTRAVVLCSPNDPTGALIDLGELREFCADLPAHVSVLLDEALVEFAPDGASAAAMVDELANLLVFRSLSKGWALAGLRAGYALGPAEATPLLAELEPGLGVAAPALAAISSVLEPGGRSRTSMQRRRRAAADERDRLGRLLRATPFSFVESAAHVVWLRGDGFDGHALVAELATRRIAVKLGSPWGDEEHVRVTLRDRSATERLVAALEEIAAARR